MKASRQLRAKIVSLNKQRGGDNVREYSVYIHLNKINHKMYIGLTKQRPESRWGTNGINYKDRCPYFWQAIQKYGWDNFEHIVYANHLTKEEACEMEKELIKYYNTQDKSEGYNIMEGGDAPTIPQDVREKMSKAMIGNKNGLGKPCSPEKAKKISDAQKGKKLTEEHKKNISIAKKGKTHKPISQEARNKIAEKHIKKRVYCLETDKIYESIQQCGRELNLGASNVCAVCKGKHKTHKGYHFSYYNDTINA